MTTEGYKMLCDKKKECQKTPILVILKESLTLTSPSTVEIPQE